MILRRNQSQFQLEGDDEITDVLEIDGPTICEIDGEQLLVDPRNGKVFELVEVDDLELENDFDFDGDDDDEDDIDDEDDEDDDDEDEDEDDDA